MLPSRSMVSVRGSSSAFSAVTGAGGAFSAGAGEWLLHPKIKPDSNATHRKKAHGRGREMDRFMEPISGSYFTGLGAEFFLSSGFQERTARAGSPMAAATSARACHSSHKASK